VDQEGLVYMFNSAAQKLFGFAEPSERGMRLEELPMDNHSRQALLRRHQSVVQTQKQTAVRNLHMVTNRFDGQSDVHFTPLSRDTGRRAVIVMFEVQQPGKGKKEVRRAKKPLTKAKKASSSKKKKRKK
jgi:nitrogen-specific signal transduction histidine kinase